MSGYYPMTAQDLARARRQRLAKLARDGELLAHVVDRLRAGWSPQQIAGRLRQLAGASGDAGKLLCHKTIYRHVYGPKGRADSLLPVPAPGASAAGSAAWAQAARPAHQDRACE